MTTIFFATDVHGSGTCWNKFIHAGKFYRAEVLILGGDMTGKAIVPILKHGRGTYQVALLEHETILRNEDELNEMMKLIRSRGYYPYLTDPDEIRELEANPEKVSQIFVTEVLKTAEQWLAYADKALAGTGRRCYVCPGNDDIFELDEIIRSSKCVELAEGQVIVLNNYHEMISCGWSNRTPWRTFREADEEDLLNRYQEMFGRVQNPHTTIVNFHVPPFDSGLDSAPEMTADLKPKYAGNSLVPVGSRAVRQVIQQYQPMVGFFGHVHESRGATRIGRTLCLNPGSMYEQGSLCGALVKLEKNEVKSYVLTTG